MTQYTGFADKATGLTIYAKPRSLSNSPWNGDVIPFTENGSLGEYSSSILDDILQYVLFINIDGTPGNEANTDTRIGYFMSGTSGGSGGVGGYTPFG